MPCTAAVTVAPPRHHISAQQLEVRGFVRILPVLVVVIGGLASSWWTAVRCVGEPWVGGVGSDECLSDECIQGRTTNLAVKHIHACLHTEFKLDAYIDRIPTSRAHCPAVYTESALF
ncbi:hypothetical protein BD410DRAFT_797313 [Rickenella mellea]|uniref:Uncharacterized protein n=1 Tax=Rickenella mellea TaxID=50990 RepID=A0A4Y7PH52_9AGAM|nr:hypothetical protein BD410DRAFT_797313 [Rickenella mellea]